MVRTMMNDPNTSVETRKLIAELLSDTGEKKKESKWLIMEMFCTFSPNFNLVAEDFHNLLIFMRPRQDQPGQIQSKVSSS